MPVSLWASFPTGTLHHRLIKNQPISISHTILGCRYTNLWLASASPPFPPPFPTPVPLRAPGELPCRLELKQMRVNEMVTLGKMIWPSNKFSQLLFNLKEIYGHQCREFVVDIGLKNQLLGIAKTWHHILLWNSENCEQQKIIFWIVIVLHRKSQSGVVH